MYLALQKCYDWEKKKYTDDLDKDYVELKELSGKIYSDWYCDMKASEHMASIYLLTVDDPNRIIF